MARYICEPCGWIYDESIGDVEHGLAAGTLFADIPDDWECPDCLIDKTFFRLLPD